jgi:hypothetical protein
MIFLTAENAEKIREELPRKREGREKREESALTADFTNEGSQEKNNFVPIRPIRGYFVLFAPFALSR